MKQLTKTVLWKMMKMERLTEVNTAHHEVVKIVLIHRISIPPPQKRFSLIRTRACVENPI